MEHYPYAVSGPQHRFSFFETVPFSKRLHNHCCGDFKEAHGENIMDAYDSTMPQKEKDPGSFTLPCLINNICFDKALVDLGASVSVMPLSTYTNLGLGELSHTRMTIELADRTIKQPKGIASNVLVMIGKFVFPIDFVILDIPEDGDIPLILGRPFLFISLLLEYMMPEYDNEELTINPTQVFSVHNWALKPNQTEGPPFTDHVKAICNLDVHVDSKAPKPSSQTEEVPQGKSPRAKSGLRRKQSSKHKSESKTEASKFKIGQSEKETQSSLAKDKSPSYPSPLTPVVDEMHKEADIIK
ncbi:hypothetical protein Tco_1028646 [Tanacetum coccineum]|uniref:Aspartic peptidase DDI1-type domain-containing protein n=1 Tax=Tanacetum coccineum TaxID=301880 RepID=A0ABQ5G2K5_9ASTR